MSRPRAEMPTRVPCRGCQGRQRPTSQTGRGYVLITTLAALILLTLVASRLDVVVARYRAESQDWSQWAEAQASLISARDEALFAMATRELSAWGFGQGIGAIRADGRVYRAQSGALVSVQDERGLIGLNLPNIALLRNHLLARGVPDRDVEPLLDTLADYSDTDSLHRLNGAEAEHYAAANLPPPRNDWLVSPHEIRQILRWRDYPDVWMRAADVFSAARGEPFNVNNAPIEVLEALPGATPEGVTAVIARRETQPFISMADLQATSGIRLNEDEVLLHPGVLYRLRVWLERGLPGIEYHIILTPGGISAPWLILETRQIAQPGTNHGKTIPPLPSLPLATPVQDELSSPLE